MKKEEVKPFKLNDVVSLKRSEVTITNFEQRDEVGTKQASDGGTFIAIQYTIKSISEEPVKISIYT
ncbi:hypothetical protein [Pseudalkalibacillus hwajinpoensis]|uniref:hypothetical protein n=1 Tax=Guptibacillus hwajinpoensis TaxID=208199 RepID=UPI001CFE4D4D|nr:hypothetical protein [Pseudalkalibacillus hwajinpoensis]